MKCIEGTCQCLADQYFSNKCEPKRGNLEFCWIDYQCQSHLNCRDGKCQCDVDYYHLNGKCIKRKTLNEACNGDQCLNSSMLYCDSKSGKCACETTRLLIVN